MDPLFAKKTIVSGDISKAQSERFEIVNFFSCVLLVDFCVYHLMVECAHTTNTACVPPESPWDTNR